MPQTILYFGSFNPVHNGHIAIAEYVLRENIAEQAWFVVSPQNPLKPAAMLAPETDRLEMVKVAVAESEFAGRMQACDIEFGLPRPSYTIDTLGALVKKYPEREFSLLMGGDILPQLERWKEWRRLIDSYKIYVYPRPGYDIADTCRDNGDYGSGCRVSETALEYGDNDILEIVKEKIILLRDAPLYDCSSTEVREAALEGSSLEGLVPAGVAAYIKTHSLWTKR